MSAWIPALLACMIFCSPLRADDLTLQWLLEATHGSAQTAGDSHRGTGADIADANGTTPLMCAATEYAEIVRAALRQCASTGMKNADAATALSLARAQGQKQIVELFAAKQKHSQ